MRKIWVVVADEAIVRILTWPETGDELQPVQEYTDPTAHAKNSDLRDDAYGRRGSHDSSSVGHKLRGQASATSGAGLEEKHLQAEAFAKRMAQGLAEAQQQGRFDELQVVAAPRFLGLLRKNYSKSLQAVISVELDKDLVHASNRELRERLFPGGNRPGARISAEVCAARRLRRPLGPLRVPPWLSRDACLFLPPLPGREREQYRAARTTGCW